MSAHNWTNPETATCRRCGATRTWDGRQEDFTYNLGDGLGAISTRPACGKGGESRRTRKMGRRAKVLARVAAPRPKRPPAVIPTPEEAAALVEATNPTVPASDPDVAL